jgi:hypothetical protein
VENDAKCSVMADSNEVPAYLYAYACAYIGWFTE